MVVMAPSEQAEWMREEAVGGSADAMTRLGVWHHKGFEGLEQNDVKAAAFFRQAADLGHAPAERSLAGCYFAGQGVEQNYSLAVEWGRKAADQGEEIAQFVVGKWYALGKAGVKKDLHMGKRYLELSAGQVEQRAVELLMELRKCVACGKLDVHHMICSRCRNRRYCDKGCQLWHWNSATDPHKLYCVKRREAAAAQRGGANPSADNAECAMEEAPEVVAAAAAAAAEVEAAKAAVDAASVASDAATTAVTAARAAMLAAPAASKKEKKKKAKLVAKVKAAEIAAQATAVVASQAGAAYEAATAALLAALYYAVTPAAVKSTGTSHSVG